MSDQMGVMEKFLKIQENIDSIFKHLMNESISDGDRMTYFVESRAYIDKLKSTLTELAKTDDEVVSNKATSLITSLEYKLKVFGEKYLAIGQKNPIVVTSVDDKEGFKFAKLQPVEETDNLLNLPKSKSEPSWTDKLQDDVDKSNTVEAINKAYDGLSSLPADKLAKAQPIEAEEEYFVFSDGSFFSSLKATPTDFINYLNSVSVRNVMVIKGTEVKVQFVLKDN